MGCVASTSPAVPAARATLVAAVPVLLLLAGCIGVEGRPPVGFTALPPQPPPPLAEAPTAGAIFIASRFTGLAEDDRARRVGDIVTIVLVERTSAAKSAAANASRKAALSLTLPKAAPFTSLPPGLFSGGTDTSFAGAGGATQSNQLSGEISVSVVGVADGGILLLRGRKVVRLNRGDEYVTLTGRVRARDLGPDNRVPSNRVADAQIAYSGTGELAAQSRQGWAARLLAFFTPF